MKLYAKIWTLIVLMFAVTLNTAAQSPYIYKVYEFCPAPGQFINTMPEYEEGDDSETMRQKAEEYLVENNQSMVCLGGFGGYIVFGFDHMIESRPGYYDLQILGNAFFADANPNPERPGGSAEPGVIYVSYDENGNGEPDDEWYEIAGSEFNHKDTRRDYEITYFRPADGKEAVKDPDSKFITDAEYIYWTDNYGESGFVRSNVYHRQSYWPEWVGDAPFLTFSGTLLPNNAEDASAKQDGTYFVLYMFDYGYADNYPNTHERSKINLDWAVDAEGNKADIPGIHFVKVMSGMRQEAGWLGETSTEVLDAWDLHLKGGDDIENITAIHNIKAQDSTLPDCYDLSGRKVKNPAKGLYIKNGKKLIIK